MARPNFENIKTGSEFNTWYWLKEEMVAICKQLNLPSTGRKFDLRDRIMYALDNNGEIMATVKKKTISKFNWTKSELTPDTIITDNVTFGQNFRGFMVDQIGENFSFNIAFMDWVKNNPGKRLGDAVHMWTQIEERNKNPDFKTEIAKNNMFNQYTRDFLSDNPNLGVKDARNYWLLKKKLPTKNGFIEYHKSDLKLSPKK